MKMILILLLTILFLPGCTSFQQEVNVVVEWADTVRWNGKEYSFDEEISREKQYKVIREEIGVVSFNVIGSKEESNPNYQLKNGEATIASKGSSIFSIKGIDPDEYVLIQNKVYACRE